MTIYEIIIICIFAASLFANVCYVFFNARLGKHTYRWDLFRWISSYQLFADTPRNFVLHFRDKLAQDELSEWCEARLVIKRRWYHPFFYPESLVTDSIYSFVDDLVRFTEMGMDTVEVSKSFHFKTVLRYILRFPVAKGTVGRQFKIEETGGHISNQSPQKVFISEFNECTSR